MSGSILPELFWPSVIRMMILLFDFKSRSRFNAVLNASPMAVWSALIVPISSRSRFSCKKSWSSVNGAAMNACAANTTSPMRSFGRWSMNCFKTERAMLKRFTRWPRTTKSSEIMLPDMSSAQTMSMPLALTVVWLFIKRGCASAIMNAASTSQRNAARKAPARERRARVNPSTSRTDE